MSTTAVETTTTDPSLSTYRAGVVHHFHEPLTVEAGRVAARIVFAP